MTISKEQALRYVNTAFVGLTSDDYGALMGYIESVDSDTSIRAELRRAAMTDGPLHISTAAWLVADAFVYFYEPVLPQMPSDERSWFFLFVAECL